jgi:NAD(P) transhydrogenase subunit alpha
VTIVGPTNLPATLAHDASQMYSKNATAFLLHLVKDGRLTVNDEDEIATKTLVARAGEVVNPRVREALESSAKPSEDDESEVGVEAVA